MLSLSLAATSLTLWALAGWTWWIAVPLIGGLIVVRLPLALFPPLWRPWASQWAVAVLALGVTLWLVTMVSTLSLGIGLGVGGLVLAWHLRGRQPAWLPWAAAGLSVALVIGCGAAEWLLWRADEARRAQSEEESRKYRVAKMRPDTPLKALHWIVGDLAYDEPFWICWMFTEDGRRQFASAVGAGTCEEAVHQLHDQITPGRTGDYGGATVAASDITEADRGVIYLAACRMYVIEKFEQQPPPGPQLGTFTLAPDPEHSDALLITGYTPCGEDPPGKPTSTPQPPDVLPSYPPGFASTLTKAIAQRDTDACQLFTNRGRQQFADVIGGADCPAAIDLLADQVTDATTYATPSSTAPTTTASGRTMVDACQLSWTKWGHGDVRPGPQLGYLDLVRPDPAVPGYLVDGFRPC